MALSKVNPNFVEQTPYGRRNLIINGAMEVAQRGTSHTTSVTNGYHTVDRIRVMGGSNVGQWTTSQDSDAPAGFVKSLKYECTTADTSLASTDHLGLGYFPEGHHMNPVSKGTSGAKSMTLSFYMKANVTKTLVVELSDAGLFRHVNFAVTPTAINTWERITLSIPADTSGGFNAGTNSKAAELNFWLASGTNYTSGSNQSTWTSRTAANIMAGVSNWADTVGNTLWITGLQLEVGDIATPFEHRSYGEELSLCQRYFYAKTREGSSNNHLLGMSYWSSTTSNECVLQHPVHMRAAPTISVDTIGDFYGLIPQQAWQQASNVQLNEGGPNTTKVSFTCSSNGSFSVDGRRSSVIGIRGDSGRLKMDAEL